MYRLIEQDKESYETVIKIYNYEKKEEAIEALIEKFRELSDFLQMRDRDMMKDIEEIEVLIRHRGDYSLDGHNDTIYWIEKIDEEMGCKTVIKLNEYKLDKIGSFWLDEHSKHMDN